MTEAAWPFIHMCHRDHHSHRWPEAKSLNRAIFPVEMVSEEVLQNLKLQIDGPLCQERNGKKSEKWSRNDASVNDFLKKVFDIWTFEARMFDFG